MLFLIVDVRSPVLRVCLFFVASARCLFLRRRVAPFGFFSRLHTGFFSFTIAVEDGSICPSPDRCYQPISKNIGKRGPSIFDGQLHVIKKTRPKKGTFFVEGVVGFYFAVA